MEGLTKARRIGTSVGVLIPSFAAKSLGIEAGTPLIMAVIDKEIIIKPKYPQARTMHEHLTQIITEGITEDLEV